MATAESSVLQQTDGPSITLLLTKSWIDKVVAAIAMVPFVYSVVVNYHNVHWNIPSVLWLVDMLIIISTTFSARLPCA